MARTSVKQRGERARVVLDARPLSHPQSGGFRSYLRALMAGLTAISVPDIELILYLDRPLPDAAMRLLPPGSQTRLLSPSRLRTDLLLFRRQVRRDAPDLVHGTQNYLPPGITRPASLTLHDAFGIRNYPWERATRRTLRERLIHGYWAGLTRLSARCAHRIITVSAFSRQEIRDTLGLSGERLVVVPNGVVLPASGAGIERRRDTLLAMASPDARKNLGALYRAVAEYGGQWAGEAPRLEVICTSSITAARTRESLARYGVERAVLREAIDDQALADTYAAATVFVWPSCCEGFGLPPLEAMWYGCPVISSSAPSMPEVLGDAPLYFSPDRPDELADVLARVLTDADLRRNMAAAGRGRAAAFSCERMARETVAVWREILGMVAT